MKFKQIGKKLITLVLALIIMFPTNLAAFASTGDPNMGGGSQGSWGTANEGSSWGGMDGVRVTLVDAQTGEIKSASIDYTNYNVSNVAWHFGKVCKTDYVKNKVALVDYFDAYEYKNPPAALPKIIEGDIQTVRKYFTDEGVLRGIAEDIKFDPDPDKAYRKLVGGEYKLLIEPIAYFTYNNIYVAATATEAALLAKQLQPQSGLPFLHGLRPVTGLNLPWAIYLETPDLGYNIGSSVSKHYYGGSSKHPYYTIDDIVSTLGIGIVRFPETTTPTIPIHYYQYNYEVTVDPDNPDPSDAELKQKIKNEGIKPKITATQGSAPSDKNYNPLVDPNCPKGELHGTQAPSPEWVKKAPPISKEYPYMGNGRSASVCVVKFARATSFDEPESYCIVHLANLKDDEKPKVIEVKIVNITIKIPGQPEPGTDRIKSYDVTQFIDQTVNNSEIQEGKHLDPLVGYAHTDPDSYNKDSGVFVKTATHDVSDAGVITSIDGRAEQNDKVHAANNLTGSVSAPGHPASYTYPFSWTGSDGTVHSTTYHGTCYVYESRCHWTKEFVTVQYGFQAPKIIQKTKVSSDGKSIEYTPGWKLPTTPVAVGFTVPEKYYAAADVVKAAGSHVYQDNTKYKNLVHVLSKYDDKSAYTTGYHSIKASKYAMFDVVPQNTNEYWIQYYNNQDEQIGTTNHMQYTQFDSDKDVKPDENNRVGDGKFSFLSSGQSITGAKYIAHRDLLAADEVATSLAVSGYMAKYAYDSDTFDYLTFMERAGFTFRGLSNKDTTTNKDDAHKLNYAISEASKIDHENRVVWVSTANDKNKGGDLDPSKDGSGKGEYNTEYVGGKGRIQPSSRQQVHFGLGGLSEDGGDIFAHIADTNLKDLALNTTHIAGDAARSDYYYADYTQGANASCYGLIMGGGTNQGTHSCPYTTDRHTSAHTSALTSCLSGNKFVAKPGADIYKNNMSKTKVWSSPDLAGGFHAGAIEKIEASRLSFEIPLAVEGTTNGRYDEKGIKGLAYNTNLIRLDTKTKRVTHIPSDELSNAKAKRTQKTFEEPTFELVSADYADVGKENKHSGVTVLAEYRLTTPTPNYVFNPSIAMAFDDTLDDVNKSVWMLSEQQREINFKHILDLRLTYNAGNSSSNTGVSNGYGTTLKSEFSTDKQDMVVRDVTNLQTIKASGAYSTETTASGGTLTAYVVLQDPEFTGEPDKVKAQNQATMTEFNKQMEAIRKQIAGATGQGNAVRGTKTNATQAEQDAFGLSMYTNMRNGSSLNSYFTDIFLSGSDVLTDKEPMVLVGKTELTAKVATGTNGDSIFSAVNDNSWSYYAMPGYKVIGYNGDKNTDISNTTSEGKRKIELASGTFEIKTSTDATKYQQDQIKDLNAHLCNLMVRQGDAPAVPEGTYPYLDPSEGSFDWYNEDYEGFVIAVYEIQFAVGGTSDGQVTNVNRNTQARTEFHSVYRSESDWQTNTNTNIAGPLKVKYGDILDSAGITFYTGKSQLKEDGTLDLMTSKGRDNLKAWSKQLAAKSPSIKFNSEDIYGAGLELTNLKIKFGFKYGSDSGKSEVIDTGDEGLSFFYQPTYFNIRGSVYDTAR